MHRLDNLKTQRTGASLTVTQLALKSNTSELWISRGETGNPFPIRESQRIADVLGVSLTTLGKVDV